MTRNWFLINLVFHYSILVVCRHQDSIFTTWWKFILESYSAKHYFLRVVMIISFVLSHVIWVKGIGQVPLHHSNHILKSYFISVLISINLFKNPRFFQKSSLSINNNLSSSGLNMEHIQNFLRMSFSTKIHSWFWIIT
jgi:hypothetical protein